MNTSEADLIQKLSRLGSRPPSKSGLAVAVGDDAALFAPRRGHQTILSCDWFLEGTHFLRDQHPADIVGWKCLARALSDIAAMGGEPRCFLLSLALPPSLAGRWLMGFLAGLLRSSRKLTCPLAGGDTTRQQKILINITVVGEVRAGYALLRSGARPGDILYVSGRLGEADLGLRLLGKGARVNKGNRLLRKHLCPEPRITLGRWLADRRVATAMMDLSDGLSTDLPRLCAASRVGARVEAAKIPAVQVPKRYSGRKIDALDLALHGGDDYELLFTVRPSNIRRLPQTFQGIPLTAIGEITRDRVVKLADLEGQESSLKPGGWDPFRTAPRNR
jgi:thiamine-monophosphate kinase